MSMDITESSVESFCAVGVSLDESDEFQQLVGVTLDSSVDFDDSHATEDELLPCRDHIPVAESTPVKKSE